MTSFTEPWSFSVEDLPEDQRAQAWGDLMRRLRLPMADLSSTTVTRGDVTVVTTPLGCEFAVISSGPQVYSGQSDDPARGIWLGVFLEGQARLETADIVAGIGQHAVLYGATGVDSTLRIDSDFRLAVVKLPEVAISARLVAPLGRRVGMLAGQPGLERIFHGLLAETGRGISTLQPSQFQPIEQALIEFLVVCLAGDGKIESRGGAQGARASHLRRICQKIETRLHDPDLSLAVIAGEHGVSPRYLQKLFTQNDETFSAYLKHRRLERCHADLISPLHAQLSISEIGFRWGFNDAAHFSRSFRDRYGLSPREHRHGGLR
jgi:AraC-like DNA-binding protein